MFVLLALKLEWVTRNDYITEQMSVEDAKQLEYNQKRIAYQMKRAAERYVRKEFGSEHTGHSRLNVHDHFTILLTTVFCHYILFGERSLKN